MDLRIIRSFTVANRAVLLFLLFGTIFFFTSNSLDSLRADDIHGQDFEMSVLDSFPVRENLVN